MERKVNFSAAALGNYTNVITLCTVDLDFLITKLPDFEESINDMKN